MPHPCVLFSSSPYLRYILGEKIFNVNPKLTFSSQETKQKLPLTSCNLREQGQRPAFPSTSHTSAQPTTANTEAYKHKLAAFRLPQSQHSSKKAQEVCRGGAALRPPLRFYLTTRTLYIPSISLSSSSALAEAALSRSIRV